MKSSVQHKFYLELQWKVESKVGKYFMLLHKLQQVSYGISPAAPLHLTLADLEWSIQGLW